MQPVPCFYLFKKLFPLCVILLLISINISKVNAKKNEKKKDSDCGVFYKMISKLGLADCSDSKSKSVPEPTVQENPSKNKEAPSTSAKETEKKVNNPKIFEKKPSYSSSDGIVPKFSVTGMQPVDSIESKESQEKKNPWVEGYDSPPVPGAGQLSTEQALEKTDGKNNAKP